LLGVLFKILFAVILLPFKLFGALFKLMAGVAGFAVKLILLLGIVLLAPFLLAGGALGLALLPVLLIGLAVWGLVRLLRPRPAARPAV
jgi:hypothetical protein